MSVIPSIFFELYVVALVPASVVLAVALLAGTPLGSGTCGYKPQICTNPHTTCRWSFCITTRVFCGRVKEIQRYLCTYGNTFSPRRGEREQNNVAREALGIRASPSIVTGASSGVNGDDKVSEKTG